MNDLVSVRIVVYGHVQGVFFRDFTTREAINLGITGYVQNSPSTETVYIQAEGKRKQLEKLINLLRIGPPAAKVEKILTTWLENTGIYASFSIRY
ncbi:MAG: acylphosphatase [Dehalococcoidales bacterium]|nr:acylphosphatase [Dehalococcoidales bacterium]